MTVRSKGEKSHDSAHALAFGAAFFGAAFFLGAMAFFTGCGLLLFVTRPDLVLPRATGFFSSTAGAW